MDLPTVILLNFRDKLEEETAARKVSGESGTPSLAVANPPAAAPADAGAGASGAAGAAGGGAGGSAAGDEDGGDAPSALTSKGVAGDGEGGETGQEGGCLLYTSPSPRD